MTESRSEDDDIEFDEQNIADDDESSNGDPESPTAEAVAKAFLDSVDKYVEYEETDQNHPESAFSPKNGMSGVVYVGQNGNYHHNSNGHAPSGLIADELESDENLQVLKSLFLIYFWLFLKWLIGKNEVLFVVHKFQNFDSLQTCIKSADRKNNELHN